MLIRADREAARALPARYASAFQDSQGSRVDGLQRIRVRVAELHRRADEPDPVTRPVVGGAGNLIVAVRSSVLEVQLDKRQLADRAGVRDDIELDDERERLADQHVAGRVLVGVLQRDLGHGLLRPGDQTDTHSHDEGARQPHDGPAEPAAGSVSRTLHLSAPWPMDVSAAPRRDHLSLPIAPRIRLAESFASFVRDPD